MNMYGPRTGLLNPEADLSDDTAHKALSNKTYNGCLTAEGV